MQLTTLSASGLRHGPAHTPAKSPVPERCSAVNGLHRIWRSSAVAFIDSTGVDWCSRASRLHRDVGAVQYPPWTASARIGAVQ